MCAERLPPSAFLTAPIAPYRYPDDEPAWPGCEVVKRYAAKVARARTEGGRDKARIKLTAALDELDDEALELWAGVVMVDRRWCGATGEGAYHAVASKAVNDVAAAILVERQAVDALVRREDSPMNEAEAARLHADVLKGRGLASICGEHRATVAEVESVRRATAWRR